MSEPVAPRRRQRRPPAAGGLASRTLSTRGRRLAHWLLLFLACALLLNSLVGDNGFLAMRRARLQSDRLDATLQAERAENARLREEARLLREDPNTIEDVARRELGLIAPGERLFILKDVAPPAGAKP